MNIADELSATSQLWLHVKNDKLQPALGDLFLFVIIFIQSSLGYREPPFQTVVAVAQKVSMLVKKKKKKLLQKPYNFVYADDILLAVEIDNDD